MPFGEAAPSQSGPVSTGAPNKYLGDDKVHGQCFSVCFGSVIAHSVAAPIT